MKITSSAAVLLLTSTSSCQGFSFNGKVTSESTNRRNILHTIVSSVVAGGLASAQPANADSPSIQETLDIDNYLRTGMDSSGPMGVSSQAGKSRPQTGVVLRDGSDVRQDKSGNVFAELLTGTKANPKAVLVSFTSPWKLETGPVFDIETRDGRTGDGALIAVTSSVNGKRLADLPSDFFLERLFSPTGRFSFYGPPTDIKIKKSTMDGNYRIIEVTYSNLSQSTNAEIPRRALIAATIPEGTDNAILLVGSSTAARWKKGSQDQINASIASFRATPAPKSNLKLRPKQRGDEIDFN